jgi:hypothetical protein
MVKLLLLAGLTDCFSEVDQFFSGLSIAVSATEDILNGHSAKTGETFCGAVDAITVFERDFRIEVEEGGGESVEHDLTPFSMSMMLEYQV